jgi:hypothetical protein
MALFDNNPLYNNISSLTNPVTSGLGNLFDGMNVFGTSIPTGVLGTGEEEKLRKQSLLQGLLGTAATYLATPKNLNTGSALPYLGKAFLGGMGASQDVVDRALNNAYRQKLLAGKEDNLRTIKQDRFEITQERQPDGSFKEIARSPLDAPKDTKARQYTGNFENVAINMFPDVDPTDLTESQRKQVFNAVERLTAAGTLARLPLQEQEAAYNMGRPPQSVSVTAGGKTYYFKDQNSANAFRQKAGIK